jgi:hypothetical protein
MSKFALNKDFESIRVNIPKAAKSFEINKIGKDEYALLEHAGDSVGEIYTFTKEELRSIWIMLSANE